MLLGLLAAAAVPGAVAASETLGTFDLLQAAGAIPFAGLAGAVAVWLARRARLRVERTLGRVGGLGTASAGRALGVIGLLFATAGGIALATYYALTTFAE